MDVRLPNGKLIRGVPEGTTKEEIKSKAIKAGLATKSDFGGPAPEESVEPQKDQPIQSPAMPEKEKQDITTKIDQSLKEYGLGPLVEFAGGVNRTIFDVLDFIGPDTANAVLDVAGIDYDVPTLRESFGMDKGSFDESLAGRAAGSAGEVAAMGAGAGAALRQGAKALPELAKQGESAAAGLLRTMGQTTPAADVALGAVSGAGEEVGRDVGGETGAMVGAIGAPVAAVAGPQAVKRLFTRQSPVKQEIARLIQDKTPDTSTAKYKLADDAAQKSLPDLRPKSPVQQIRSAVESQTPRIAKDSTARETLKQGFDEGVIAAVKQASKSDKRKMLKMVNAMEQGKRNKQFAMRNRPADVAGDSLLSRIKTVRKINKEAGSELEKVAKGLKGKPVEQDRAIDQFINDLGEIGVSIGDDLKPVFRDSDIEGQENVQRIISRMVKRLADTKAPDAYDAHRLKRYIDENVSYGKRQEGMTATTERILKNLRRNIDSALDEAYPAYDKANTKYADTRQALDSIAEATPSKLDIMSPSADKQLGTTTRRLMSNAQSRGNLIDSIDTLETTAKKYGANFDDDLMIQTLFADELDTVFKPVARTSFQGQVEQGIKAGLDATQETAAGMAARAGKSAVDKLKGVNEENAFKSIKELLTEGAK